MNKQETPIETAIVDTEGKPLATETPEVTEQPKVKEKKRYYYIDRSKISGVRKEVELEEKDLLKEDLDYLWFKLEAEFKKYPAAIQMVFARNMAYSYQQYIMSLQLTNDAIKQQNESSNSEDTNTKGEEVSSTPGTIDPNNLPN